MFHNHLNPCFAILRASLVFALAPMTAVTWASRRTWITLLVLFFLLAAFAAYYFYPRLSPPRALTKQGAKPAPTSLQWEAKIDLFAETFSLSDNDKSSASAAHALSDPFGIAIDKKGDIYLADAGEHNRILKITAQGQVLTFAGGKEGYLDSQGKGSESRFHTPSGIAVDQAGVVYVADTGNHVIRQINPQGEVTTLAGTGVAGDRDGAANQAQFNGPIGVAVDAAGVVWVTDTYNDKIKKITRNGQVLTVAGAGQAGFQDGAADQALFDTPSHIALLSNGDLIVTDTRNHTVRKISTQAQVSTLMRSDPKDQDALLRRPMGLAVTHDDHIYVSELSHGRLHQIAPNGERRGVTGVDIDIIPGDDTSPRMLSPVALAITPQGSLLVSDNALKRLHRISERNSKEMLIAPTKGANHHAPRPGPGPLPWPLLPQDQAHEIVGTMGEVRGNYEGDSRDHFHRGLDIQANIGDPVVVIHAEKVASPLTAWAAATINEGMRIEQFSYIHMKVGRDAKDQVLDANKFQLIKNEQGKLQQIRIRRGTRFQVGERIGSVNSMAHVHLNYAPKGEVLNPLQLQFPGLRDQVAPRIDKIMLADRYGDLIQAPPLTGANQKSKGKSAYVQRIAHSNQDTPLVLARSLGEVSIIVDAYDQADGNLARRRLGLYEFAYQILDAQQRPVAGFEQAKMTHRFDRLPMDEEAVKIAYAENSGITVHGHARTRFLYNISNQISDGHARLGYWRIQDLPSGEYTLRIIAKDFAGNIAQGKTELRIRID